MSRVTIRRRVQERRRRIEDALGSAASRVDHIGSTAVPGLAAKPIVDIQVSVPDVEQESSYLEALVAAGYQLRVREQGHRMFRTPELDVHIHVCDAGSDWERRHLLLRDWLRESADDREAYAALKMRTPEAGLGDDEPLCGRQDGPHLRADRPG